MILNSILVWLTFGLIIFSIVLVKQKNRFNTILAAFNITSFTILCIYLLDIFIGFRSVIILSLIASFIIYTLSKRKITVNNPSAEDNEFVLIKHLLFTLLGINILFVLFNSSEIYKLIAVIVWFLYPVFISLFFTILFYLIFLSIVLYLLYRYFKIIRKEISFKKYYIKSIVNVLVLNLIIFITILNFSIISWNSNTEIKTKISSCFKTNNEQIISNGELIKYSDNNITFVNNLIIVQDGSDIYTFDKEHKKFIIENPNQEIKINGYLPVEIDNIIRIKSDKFLIVTGKKIHDYFVFDMNNGAIPYIGNAFSFTKIKKRKINYYADLDLAILSAITSNSGKRTENDVSLIIFRKNEYIPVSIRDFGKIINYDISVQNDSCLFLRIDKKQNVFPFNSSSTWKIIIR